MTDIEKREMEHFTNQQIRSEAIARLDTAEYEQLENSYKRARLVNMLISYIILSLVAIGFSYMIDDLDSRLYIVFGVLLALMLLISVAVIIYGHVRKQFIIREHDISYRRGIFWKDHISIPYNRVQHCEVNQGPIDRLYKIAKIKIYTAGGSSSDLTIPGLNPDRAEDIKGYVLQQITHDEQE